MTEKPAGTGYKQVEEQSQPFMVRCTRCRGEESFDTLVDLQTAMYGYMMMTGVTACPPCGEIILDTRRPFLSGAYNAAVDEINAYHKKNNMAPSPLLSVVGTKGEVH